MNCSRNLKCYGVAGLEPGIPDGDVDHSLPETAILLTTEWGSKVYIVGTTHFSRESQEDVANVSLFVIFQLYG